MPHIIMLHPLQALITPAMSPLLTAILLLASFRHARIVHLQICQASLLETSAIVPHFFGVILATDMGAKHLWRRTFLHGGIVHFFVEQAQLGKGCSFLGDLGAQVLVCQHVHKHGFGWFVFVALAWCCLNDQIVRALQLLIWFALETRSGFLRARLASKCWLHQPCNWAGFSSQSSCRLCCLRLFIVSFGHNLCIFLTVSCSHQLFQLIFFIMRGWIDILFCI